MAALSVCCSAALPAFAQQSTGSSAAFRIQSASAGLSSGQIVKLSKKDCGAEVDKYSVYPNCEYIMKRYTQYFHVRVIDRYEEPHKAFGIFPYTVTVADAVCLDTGRTFHEFICHDCVFYYMK